MLSESVMRPEHELLYRLAVVFSHCAQGAGKESCAAQYRLSVANSGLARHEIVLVRWPAEFSEWRIDTRSSDLVASVERRAEPEVRSVEEAGTFMHEIRNLDPDTLLEFGISCLGCTRAQAEAPRDAVVRIEARGKVIETDPRPTMFGRAVTNALRIAAAFR